MDDVKVNGENYTMKSWIICIPHPILFGWSNQGEWDGRGM